VQLENPGPALRMVDDLEKERAALAAEIHRQEQEQQPTLALMDEAMIRQFLEGLAETLEHTDRETIKDALTALIDAVILDPDTR
jgi:hypothetical protein